MNIKSIDMKRNPLLAVAVALWLPGAYAQQAAADPMPADDTFLPSPAAARAALDAAPDVAAAMARRNSSLARADGIRAGSAEFVVRATGQNRNVRNPTDNFAEGQVALERPLRLWGKSGADAALADATIETGAHALEEARHTVSRQMLSLWFGVLRARQASLAMQRNGELAAELVTATGRRVQAKDAAPMELELAQAEQARAAAALAGARSVESAAEAELRARFPALGLPPATSVAIPLTASDALLAGDARGRYLDESHALKLALAEESQAQRHARRSDLERKPDPTVGVFVTVERGGAERIAGVSVSMPLGSVQRRATAVAAAADAEAAARRRSSVEQSVGAEFDVLSHTVTGLRKAAQAQATALDLDHNAAARAGRAYAAGETSLSELLVIRRSLADTALAARLAAVNAREAEEKLRLDLHLPSRFD